MCFNIYVALRYILESEYGFNVGLNIFLGVVYVGMVPPRLIRVPLMHEEVMLIVQDQIEQGKAVSAAMPGHSLIFRLPSDGV